MNRWVCRACCPDDMDIMPCELTIRTDMRPANKPVLCIFNVFRTAKWERVEYVDFDNTPAPVAVSV